VSEAASITHPSTARGRGVIHLPPPRVHSSTHSDAPIRLARASNTTTLATPIASRRSARQGQIPFGKDSSSFPNFPSERRPRPREDRTSFLARDSPTCRAHRSRAAAGTPYTASPLDQPIVELSKRPSRSAIAPHLVGSKNKAEGYTSQPIDASSAQTTTTLPHSCSVGQRGVPLQSLVRVA